jgi:hypothetical protein
MKNGRKNALVIAIAVICAGLVTTPAYAIRTDTSSPSASDKESKSDDSKGSTSGSESKSDDSKGSTSGSESKSDDSESGGTSNSGGNSDDKGASNDVASNDSGSDKSGGSSDDSSADGAKWQTINGPGSSFTFKGTNGDVTVNYEGAKADVVGVGPNPIDNQNYDSVGAFTKTIFNTGDFVGSGDQVDHAPDIMDKNGVATFVSKVAYNYLAIHFGTHEMIFDFGTKGIAAYSEFKISTVGKAAGLSNFRAYTTSVASGETPIPGALWLFGSGLVGLLRMRKKS